MLPGPSHRAPSPPVLPGCPGDRVSERHFFPEAPLSLSHGFVQPAPLTGSRAAEKEGGKHLLKAIVCHSQSVAPHLELKQHIKNIPVNASFGI